jgi:ribonuclease BN (tRNA processing enzyme)
MSLTSRPRPKIYRASIVTRVANVRVRILGCGDAFSSGGRLHSCFLLDDGEHLILLDCGASALAALKRERVEPSEIGWVVISHLHGDHFGGLPWLLLDGIFRRRKPLLIAGPPGIEGRVERVFEAFYPAAGRSLARVASDVSQAEAKQPPFALSYRELCAEQTLQLGPARVRAFAVAHECGAPPFAVRVELGGRVIAYSGDTQWTDALIDAARGADMFICECSVLDRPVPGHLDYLTLRAKRPLLDCRRLLLTHLGEDVLARQDELEFELARDGMLIEL